jgi:plasmid stabilization system protein ParE
VRIRILRSARQDLVDGFWFYEERCDGLGEHFSESIGQDLESLLVYAGIHSMLFGKHRMIASRFPYSIFYLVEDDEIRVYAVIDNRRDPDWISDRLN